MHKGWILILFCFLAVQSVLANDGIQRVRIRSRQKQRNPTSPTTSVPSHNSTVLTTPNNAQPNSLSETDLQHTLPRRRKRVRVKKQRFHKRQGTYPEESENGGNRPLREPLYEEHADEVNVPDHYYSPIKQQRMRAKKRLFQNTVPVQPIHQPQFGQGESSNSNPAFKKRDGPRSSYPVVDHFQHEREHEQSDEFHSSTQPPPKNYAFAYAVRDDDETHSHKEARDGQLTMGEYRINLPDGRTQVVRYTAGGDIGYKADVTYEGEGDDHPRKQELTAKPTALTFGNSGYLPPILNNKDSNVATSLPAYKPSSPSPKKYRKNKNKQSYQGQNEKYGAPVPSSTPAPKRYREREREHTPPQFTYRNPAPTNLPQVDEDPTSYDKYDGPQSQGPSVYYSRPKPVEQPSYTPRPSYKKRRPRPKPTSEYDVYPSSATPSSPPVTYEKERRRPAKANSSPNYGGPVPQSRPYPYPMFIVEEKQDYGPNLEYLHDQSPRAGPGSGRKRKKVRNGDGGSGYSRPRPSRPTNSNTDYSYPGHPDIEEEINTIKHSYKPSTISYQKPQSQAPYGRRSRRPTQRAPSSTPPPLYREPGPGDYYSAVEERPSPSPSPRPTPQYHYNPSPTYRTTASPNYNYLDQEEHHHHQDHHNDDHQHQRYKPQAPVELDIHLHSHEQQQDHDHFEHETERPIPSHGGYTPINFSSKSKGLIPIEDFKAGPARKNRGPSKSKKPTRDEHPGKVIDDYYEELSKQRQREPQNTKYKEPYNYYNSQHPSYHHGGYIPPEPPAGIHQQPLQSPPSPSPSPTTSYTIDFPGGKHSFYLKTGSGSTPQPKLSNPTQAPQYYESSYKKPNRKKPSSSGYGSGLVFFETPGVGERPTKPVQNVLSHFPNSNTPTTPEPFSFPHTTIHPYEIGAKDYGQSVAYKNSFNTPSSGENGVNREHEGQKHDENHHQHQQQQEHVDDHSFQHLTRDYLLEREQIKESYSQPETRKPYFRPRKPTPAPAVSQQFFHEKVTPASSPSPKPTQRPVSYNPVSVSTASPFQFQNLEQDPDSVSYQLQDYQEHPSLLQPVSPTPAISTSYFSQPIKPQRGFSTLSKTSESDNGEELAFAQQVPDQGDVGYQYQYEEVVK